MTRENEEKPRKAVALRYDMAKDTAPRMIAKGDRLRADQIIATAHEHHIPVHEDPDLVALLAKLDVGLEIPEELYRAVAEVLAFVYRLNNRMPEPLR